jgi:outer membrane immunogenic protein
VAFLHYRPAVTERHNHGSLNRGDVVKRMIKTVAAMALIAPIQFAFAADLPVARPITAVTPVYNWHGFYIGVNAGFGWGRDEVTTFSSPTIPGFVPGLASDTRGFLGGVTWGTNYQFGRWVLGTESDFNFSDISRSETIVSGGVTNFAEQELAWFSTTRARVGVTIQDNVLVYATGGLADARARVRVSHLPTRGEVSDSDWRWGWTVGGGIEWGFGRWSVKIEYLHYDLGDTSFTYSVGPTLVTTTTAFSGDIIRAGLNYHFDWTLFDLVTGRRSL